MKSSERPELIFTKGTDRNFRICNKLAPNRNGILEYVINWYRTGTEFKVEENNRYRTGTEFYFMENNKYWTRTEYETTSPNAALRTTSRLAPAEDLGGTFGSTRTVLRTIRELTRTYAYHCTLFRMNNMHTKFHAFYLD